MTKKYRPYFSIPELECILSHLKTGEPSQEKLGLIRYLDRFLLDCQRGYRKESHTLMPTLAQKMELESLPPESDPKKLYQSWLDCNQKFYVFTGDQIRLIQQYRYENDIMTPAEESQFEKENGAWR